MSNVSYSAIIDNAPLPQRVMATLQAKVSWVESKTGEKISVSGTTENLGETSVLVNLEILPPVGSDVKIRLFDEDKKIIETKTSVIRVERDPGKPQAALSVVKNLKKWKEVALTAAQDWVTRNWQLNYEEEWAS